MSDWVRFRHHFVDADPPHQRWGAAAVGDLLGNGRLGLVTGSLSGRFVRYYEYDRGTASWQPLDLTDQAAPHVGTVIVDLDGDGRNEVVCGDWENRLLWIRPPTQPGEREWEVLVVAELSGGAHDLLAGDIDGDGRVEFVAREKDKRLLLLKPTTSDRDRWLMYTIASDLPGDGTCLADIDGDGNFDVVVGTGWFQNLSGDGTRWRYRCFLDPALELNPEVRVAVGPLSGPGRCDVVIAESAVFPESDYPRWRGRARLLWLEMPDDPLRDEPWRGHILVDTDRDMRGLHTLVLADFDRSGTLDIFTAEMESGKTHDLHPPRWFVFRNKGGSPPTFEETVILDANLGTHQAQVADFTGNGYPDIVGKTWLPNPSNGNGGRGHIDFLENLGPEPH